MPAPVSVRLFVAVAALAFGISALTPGPAAARKPQKPTTPLPVPSANGSGPLGYYLMSGNTIVSPAYENLGLCYKDLAKVKHSQEPGSDTLVCVHRRP